MSVYLGLLHVLSIRSALYAESTATNWFGCCGQGLHLSVGHPHVTGRLWKDKNETDREIEMR